MAHVTFIHGIANKPPKDQLIDIWIRSLARNDGPDLDAEGVTYSMVYWADVLYERPDDGSSTHEIQYKLGEVPDPRWTRQQGFPSAKVQGSWVNAYDRLDPVCGFDPKLANDYERASQQIARDLNEQNYGKWRHSIDKYLGQPKLQAAVSDLLF